MIQSLNASTSSMASFFLALLELLRRGEAGGVEGVAGDELEVELDELVEELELEDPEEALFFFLIEPRGHARGPRGHARGLGHAPWAADPAEATVNAASVGLRHRPRPWPHRRPEPLPGARSHRRPDPRPNRRPDPRPGARQPPRSCEAEQRMTFAISRVATGKLQGIQKS